MNVSKYDEAVEKIRIKKFGSETKQDRITENKEELRKMKKQVAHSLKLTETMGRRNNQITAYRSVLSTGSYLKAIETYQSNREFHKIPNIEAIPIPTLTDSDSLERMSEAQESPPSKSRNKKWGTEEKSDTHKQSFGEFLRTKYIKPVMFTNIRLYWIKQIL